jgi:hypothetical protein
MGATFWNYIHDKAGVLKIHEIARKSGFLTLDEFLSKHAPGTIQDISTNVYRVLVRAY